ncbi:acid-sensing ion channel 2-like [Saccostrea echinata]|uniref:acid-sensing ion channel 2-like n=1 Tax=Saccostrea echinata TaxID=191078 RepID=UPI002A7F0655|nr:acid-sensing ion channel 2-like [Saccostrea echinata]
MPLIEGDYERDDSMSKTLTEMKDGVGGVLGDSYFVDQSSDQPSKRSSGETSICHVWKELLDNTSMHGVSRIFRRKTIFHGIFWTAMMVFMLVCLTLVLVAFSTSYFSYETLINFKVEMATDMEFPTITICNVSPINISKIQNASVIYEYQLAKEGYGESFGKEINISDPKYAILHEPRNDSWLMDTSFDLRSMIFSCKFAGKENCYQFIEKRKTDVGMCFSFNGPSQNPPAVSRITGSKKGLSMFVNLDQDNYVVGNNKGAGLQVAIHHRDVEPNMVDKGFLVCPGTVSYVPIRKSKYTYLPRPYKAFGTNYCTKTTDPDFQNPLKHYPKYSHYACLRECRSRFIYKFCKCRLITDIGDEIICTIAQEDRCAFGTRDVFDGSPKFQAACNCLIPCEEVEFEKEISSAQFPSEKFREVLYNLYKIENISTNYLELKFYYDTFVTDTVEQVPKVDITSVLGNIGGYLGIFLGASLLTITEVFEVVVLTACVFLRRIIRHIKCFLTRVKQRTNMVTISTDTTK